jgi:CRISPR-associated protein Cmr4
MGTVDLPIQRERHTQWPMIAASAIKGILRDACREHVAHTTQCSRAKADNDGALVDAFGPPTAEADKQAGAISVTDARLLVFPVRSLKGIFAWATCPAALERLQRDAALAGQSLKWAIPHVEENNVVCSTDSPCLIDGKQVVLEEFDFTRSEGDVGPAAQWITQNLLSGSDVYAATRNRFARQFLVLHDNDFTHFARHATEVSARIALNYETKTVKDGALFYQEFLPAETLLYSVVLAGQARNRSENGQAATSVLEFVRMSVREVLQIGGDETTGKGLCSIQFAPGKAA